MGQERRKEPRERGPQDFSPALRFSALPVLLAASEGAAAPWGFRKEPARGWLTGVRRADVSLRKGGKGEGGRPSQAEVRTSGETSSAKAARVPHLTSLLRHPLSHALPLLAPPPSTSHHTHAIPKPSPPCAAYPCSPPRLGSLVCARPVLPVLVAPLPSPSVSEPGDARHLTHFLSLALAGSDLSL